MGIKAKTSTIIKRHLFLLVLILTNITSSTAQDKPDTRSGDLTEIIERIKKRVLSVKQYGFTNNTFYYEIRYSSYIPSLEVDSMVSNSSSFQLAWAWKRAIGKNHKNPEGETESRMGTGKCSFQLAQMDSVLLTVEDYGYQLSLMLTKETHYKENEIIERDTKFIKENDSVTVITGFELEPGSEKIDKTRDTNFFPLIKTNNLELAFGLKNDFEKLIYLVQKSEKSPPNQIKGLNAPFVPANFIEADILEAMEKSVASNRPILLIMDASFSGWIKLINKRYLEKPEFSEWLSQNVIPLYVYYRANKTSSRYHLYKNEIIVDDLRKEYFRRWVNVKEYPTFILFKPVKKEKNFDFDFAEKIIIKNTMKPQDLIDSLSKAMVKNK